MKHHCQADIYGGKHPGAVYRVTVGGYAFNSCVRCVGYIGRESRRTRITFSAKQISPQPKGIR